MLNLRVMRSTADVEIFGVDLVVCTVNVRSFT